MPAHASVMRQAISRAVTLAKCAAISPAPLVSTSSMLNNQPHLWTRYQTRRSTASFKHEPSARPSRREQIKQSTQKEANNMCDRITCSCNDSAETICLSCIGEEKNTMFLYPPRTRRLQTAHASASKAAKPLTQIPDTNFNQCFQSRAMDPPTK